MRSFLILLLIAVWLVLGYCLEPRLVPHVAAQPEHPYQGHPYQPYAYLAYAPQGYQAYSTLGRLTGG